jgi:hypothetical protein
MVNVPFLGAARQEMQPSSPNLLADLSSCKRKMGESEKTCPLCVLVQYLLGTPVESTNTGNVHPGVRQTGPYKHKASQLPLIITEIQSHRLPEELEVARVIVERALLRVVGLVGLGVVGLVGFA